MTEMGVVVTARVTALVAGTNKESEVKCSAAYELGGAIFLVIILRGTLSVISGDERVGI